MKTKETSKYPEETFGLASEKSTREQAMAWWAKLDDLRKVLKKPDDRSLESLTGREIEEIWLKETGERGIIITNLSESTKETLAFLLDKPKNDKTTSIKPNQKQFKQFDETLHKAYLNKFSDEDKFKAFISNLNELSKETQFNAFLATLRKMKLDSQTESNIMTLVALKDI